MKEGNGKGIQDGWCCCYWNCLWLSFRHRRNETESSWLLRNPFCSTWTPDDGDIYIFRLRLLRDESLITRILDIINRGAKLQRQGGRETERKGRGEIVEEAIGEAERHRD